MAKLNISQAAKAAGVTRATIHKHINTGKLSVETQEDGKRVIDVSELERVYGQLMSPDTVHSDRKNLHSDTPQVTAILQTQIERLERELDVLRQERDAERQARDRDHNEHRLERDRLHGIIEKQTLLLPKPQEQETTSPPPTWWQRWLR